MMFVEPVQKEHYKLRSEIKLFIKNKRFRLTARIPIPPRVVVCCKRNFGLELNGTDFFCETVFDSYCGNIKN